MGRAADAAAGGDPRRPSPRHGCVCDADRLNRRLSPAQHPARTLSGVGHPGPEQQSPAGPARAVRYGDRRGRFDREHPALGLRARHGWTARETGGPRRLGHFPRQLHPIARSRTAAGHRVRSSACASRLDTGEPARRVPARAVRHAPGARARRGGLPQATTGYHPSRYDGAQRHRARPARPSPGSASGARRSRWHRHHRQARYRARPQAARTAPRAVRSCGRPGREAARRRGEVSGSRAQHELERRERQCAGRARRPGSKAAGRHHQEKGLPPETAPPPPRP